MTTTAKRCLNSVLSTVVLFFLTLLTKQVTFTADASINIFFSIAIVAVIALRLSYTNPWPLGDYVASSFSISLTAAFLYISLALLFSLTPDLGIALFLACSLGATWLFASLIGSRVAMAARILIEKVSR